MDKISFYDAFDYIKRRNEQKNLENEKIKEEIIKAVINFGYPTVHEDCDCYEFDLWTQILITDEFKFQTIRVRDDNNLIIIDVANKEKNLIFFHLNKRNF